MTWLVSFFSTPARQALGWTALGLLGIVMAAGGVWFLTDDGGGSPRRVEAERADTSPTSTVEPSRAATNSATATPSATPSISPTTTATATVEATATARPASNANGGAGAGANQPDPTATPVPEPTQPPVVAGGDYCPTSDQSSSPPNSVFGLFRIGGVDVPAGATVSLAFDGVVGPSRTTTEAGGYKVSYYAGPANCANRVGAAISVVYNGVAYPTGFAVGGEPAIRADIVN